MLESVLMLARVNNGKEMICLFIYESRFRWRMQMKEIHLNVNLRIKCPDSPFVRPAPRSEDVVA